MALASIERLMVLPENAGRVSRLVGGVLGVLGVAALSTGCGSGRQLTGSMSAYEVGNYHQAAEQCESVDGTSLDGRKQVRYYVYCGLAHYRLGEQDSARNMLTTGKEMYEAGSPTWLKPIIVDQMNKALGSLSGPTFAPAQYTPSAAYGLKDAASAANTRRGHRAE